jgi:hypothetical protein
MFDVSRLVRPTRVLGLFAAFAALASSAAVLHAGPPPKPHSVARQWNEENLFAIRNDLARPPIQARNLYHVSVAMYDAWAAYSPVADQVIHHEKRTATNVAAARNEAISFAAFRVLNARYANSPGAAVTLASFEAKMIELGYDPNFRGTVGNSPRALGNRIANSILFNGLNDGSNEANNFANQQYAPINPPLVVALPGNPDVLNPNRWQPLALDFFVDQNGNVILGGYPAAIAPEWGKVKSFSLSPADENIYVDSRGTWHVYHDPGTPPQIGGVGDAIYRFGHELVSVWQSHLDPTDDVLWDVSPASLGNAQVPSNIGDLSNLATYTSFYDLQDGGDNGTGYAVNPVTGLPYKPQIVPRGDYARILAEFWADGPSSETPPGHWYTILNYVSDHPLFVPQFGGQGPVLDSLEWNVKSYLVMGGAMHDAAIQCWGNKGWHDSARPITAIRYMADNGQCTDPLAANFDVAGIDLIPGLIELVTKQTTAPGGYHEHLKGSEGKIALYTWRGPPYIGDPETEFAGVGWILAENWWPYQRPTFVTPPFPGYPSGHSTYSRTAARVMGLITGDEYFPGGMSEFHCPQNEFLVFEDGPSVDVTLQWARYQDASDQCSLSRIWGGIHPPFDDLPGRIRGDIIGPDAVNRAVHYFGGVVSCPADIFPQATGGDGVIGPGDLAQLLAQWGNCPGSGLCSGDISPTFAAGGGDGVVGPADLAQMLSTWGICSSK